jgi:signal peptidase II
MISAVGVLVLDQLVKYIVRLSMVPGETIPVLPGIFHITYIRNAGAAFGVLPHQNFLFLGIVVILFALYFYYRKRIPAHPFYFPVGTGLLLGGSLGNAIDRLRFDSVIDFFDFQIWPIFNIADIGICVGIACIVLYFWRHS